MRIQINCIGSKFAEERITTIKNTWGKHHVDTVFYADFESENIIKCTDEPSAKGNEEKTINRFKQIKNNNTYDWYFFVDDDTFVNVYNMKSYVATLDKNSAYGYSVTGCLPFAFFNGGAGFFISNESFDKINPDTIYIHGSTYSDAAACQILNENNIPMQFNNTILNWDSAFNFDDNIFKNAVTFHQIKTEEAMQQYYKLVYKI
jgi:hypothetical protein